MEVAFWSSDVEDKKQSAETIQQQDSSKDGASKGHSKDECNSRTSERDDREQGSPFSDELSDAKQEICSLESSKLVLGMESGKEMAKTVSIDEGSEKQESSAGSDSAPDSLPGASSNGGSNSLPSAGNDGGSGATCNSGTDSFSGLTEELLHQSRLLSVEELLALFQELAGGKGMSKKQDVLVRMLVIIKNFATSSSLL